MPVTAKDKKQSAEPVHTQPHVIVETAVYSPEEARRALGLKKSTVAREVREGRLKVAKRAGRYYLLGEWLLAWIRSGVVTPRPRPQNGQDD